MVESLGTSRQRLMKEIESFNSANDLSALSNLNQRRGSVTRGSGAAGASGAAGGCRVLCDPIFEPPNLPINPRAIGAATESMKAEDLEHFESFSGVHNVFVISFFCAFESLPVL